MILCALAACRGPAPGAPPQQPPPSPAAPPSTIALVAEVAHAPAPAHDLPSGSLHDLQVVERCEAPPIPRYPDFWDEHRMPWPWVRFEVPYGPDIKQTFDVSWPADPDPAGPRPMVAIIHGGGWTAGDKHMFWPTMRALNDRGYVAATINYRFARNKARAFPVPVRDTRCALAYLVRHAAEYGADPSRLAVIGASAGGHIAALIAVEPNAPELSTGCEDVRLRPAGVISYYGPLELMTEEGYPPIMHEAVQELFRAERGTAEWADLARRATPRTFVDKAAPPFLLVHGTADNIVPIDDSRAFKRALDDHGVPSLLVELPEQKHGFAVLSRKAEVARATCTAWTFLDRVLAASPR